MWKSHVPPGWQLPPLVQTATDQRQVPSTVQRTVVSIDRPAGAARQARLVMGPFRRDQSAPYGRSLRAWPRRHHSFFLAASADRPLSGLVAWHSKQSICTAAYAWQSAQNCPGAFTATVFPCGSTRTWQRTHSFKLWRFSLNAWCTVRSRWCINKCICSRRMTSTGSTHVLPACAGTLVSGNVPAANVPCHVIARNRQPHATKTRDHNKPGQPPRPMSM